MYNDRVPHNANQNEQTTMIDMTPIYARENVTTHSYQADFGDGGEAWL